MGLPSMTRENACLLLLSSPSPCAKAVHNPPSKRDQISTEMADELRALGILNVVELNRRDPASKPGLSPLGSRSPIIVIPTLTLNLPKGKGKNPRICIAHSARYLEGVPPRR